MKDCCQEFYDDVKNMLDSHMYCYHHYMLFIEEYTEHGHKICLHSPVVEVDYTNVDEQGYPDFIHSYDWDEGGYYRLIGWAIIDLLEPIGAEKADIFVPAKLS